MDMVKREAEGIILKGHAWFVFPLNAGAVAAGTELHLQTTEFAVQPWWSYTPLPDANGTACLIADRRENGCVILSEEPIPPDLPPGWAVQPAELSEGWAYDDGTWTLTLQVIMGTVPFSKSAGPCVLFGGEEVPRWRLHAHRTGARIYLWLNAEGWSHFGPVLWLKLVGDTFVDDQGNLIARRTGGHWHTPGRFSHCAWETPMVTSSANHPHPDHG